jgi:hypothetical protein
VCEQFPEFLYLPLLPLYKFCHRPLAHLIPIKYLSGPLDDLPQSLVLCRGNICIGGYVQIVDGGPAEYEVELLLLREEGLNIFQGGTGSCS